MDEYMNNEKQAILGGDTAEKLYLHFMGKRKLRKNYIGDIIDAKKKGRSLVNIPKRIYEDAKKQGIKVRRPLLHFMNPMVSMENAEKLERQIVRGLQAKGVAKLVQTGTAGAVLGGSVGLARHIPKYFEARKATEPEKKEAGVKAAGDAKPNWIDQLKRLGTQGVDFDSWPSRFTQVPMGPLPGGAMIPLMALAAGGSAIGSERLVDYMTDKSRDKMLKERKKKLQDEFKTMLSGGPKSATLIGHGLEAEAAMYEKQARSTPKSDEGFNWNEGRGYAMLLAALLAGGSFSMANALSKKQSPNAAKSKALKQLLKHKAAKKYQSLYVTAGGKDDDITPTPTAMAGSQHSVPVVMPTPDALPDEDEGYDLSKMGAFYKAAADIAEHGYTFDKEAGEWKDKWNNVVSGTQQGIEGVKEWYGRSPAERETIISGGKRVGDLLSSGGDMWAKYGPKIQALLEKLKGGAKFVGRNLMKGVRGVGDWLDGDDAAKTPAPPTLPSVQTAPITKPKPITPYRPQSASPLLDTLKGDTLSESIKQTAKNTANASEKMKTKKL